MPGSYEIDSTQNLIKTYSSGVVTVGDKIAQDEAILADPNFKKNMNSMCDLSKATYDWNLEDIDKFRNFVRRIGPQMGKSKWAIICAGGATEHTARIFSVLQSACDNIVSVKIFTNRDRAMEWLKKIDLIESDVV
ncbi:MAG: hypothetical protein ACREBV_03650 [Candidatus Zixiibacteriota bacterium]